MASLGIISSFVCLSLVYYTSAQPPYEGRNSVTSLQKYTSHASPLLQAQEILQSDELHLLDTVLLASVDGHFHGVNRTTGALVWTMELPSLNSAGALTNLHDLVRTDHSLRGGNAYDMYSDDPPTETYIIEPQTGNIFLNPPDAKRDEPLQRLPFSMAQLVDKSPFVLDNRRTFLGKKRTSLISLDLRSGEVLEILDPEQAQCSWAEVPDGAMVLSKEEELLDELDPPVMERTVVHIGRTDYQVTVFLRGRPIQNLTYSAYGPNNLNKDMQDVWNRTPDNRYHQPTPDGTLLMFKTDEKEPLKAGHMFRRPIVAVFDAVRVSDRSDPLLLLQPTPPMEELYPHQRKEIIDLTGQGDITYVGRVGNSLYALSRQTFPHVIFSQLTPLNAIEGQHGMVRDVDEFGDPLDFCVSLNCLKGVHRTVTPTLSSLTHLMAGIGRVPSPVPVPAPVLAPPPLAMEEEAEGDLEVELPGPVVGATSSSPPVTEATPRRPPVTDLPALDPARIGARLWTIGPDMKNPLITGLIGLLVLVWVFAKKVQGRFGNQKYLDSIAERDMTFEPVVLPPLKLEAKSTDVPSSVVAAQILPPVDTQAKPLPPVPLDPVEEPPPSPEDERSRLEDAPDGDVEGAETEKEGAEAGSSKKKGKIIRRKRGRGGSKKVTLMDPLGKDDGGQAPRVVFSHSPAHPVGNGSAVRPTSSLVVSDTVLGYGSHGTMVFQGTFQGRAVAVKRLLQDFVTLASREVTLLQESDDHPNVIRYYFKENRDNFLYIALELCPASLADIVERPHLHPEICGAFDPKKALAQVTMGLKHLHSLKIVHRDIKPQNILISKPATGSGSGATSYRMLISDFGLCRKLESDQTSFLPTIHSGGGGMAAGTVGWRAPEILRGEVKLDESTLDMSSGGTPNSSVGGLSSADGSNGKANGYAQNRLTKAVDVFALGCLFYYTLSGAEHPYGERFEREVNIIKDVKNLDRLAPLGEEGTEAEDLITSMLAPDPRLRPDTTACLIHPFFWTPLRRLNFLQDASDRFEIMNRDPREPQLEALETNAREIVGPDWHKKLDKIVDENLGKFRKYDGKSVQDLMRALRNKKHHYQDLPDNVKRSFGVIPEGYLSYFTRRFPRLFLHVYSVVSDDPLLQQDTMFRTYFEVSD